jgi:hypothetical protein
VAYLEDYQVVEINLAIAQVVADAGKVFVNLGYRVFGSFA